MMSDASKPARDAQQRRIARACGVLGAALAIGYFLLRDAVPRGDPLRALADDSLWIITTIAVLLLMYPSFITGLIEGVEKDPPNVWSHKPGQKHAWTLIAVGASVCALSVLCHFRVDLETASHGGLTGMMRSMSVPLGGALLIGWGWARPSWLFLDEGEQEVSRTPTPTSAR
jgi:hypothetical protein